MYKKRSEDVEYKGFFAKHRVAIASTTLVGTIIGAGILGIPYVVAQTGFLYGFLLILGIGLAFLFLNLFMGEIILRTKEQHQLPGYAGKYLGIWGKRIMTFSMFVGLYGALTAYLIGEGATLHAIFGFWNPTWFTLLYFLVVAYIIFRGVKATGKAELFLIGLLLLVVILIGFFSYGQIDVSNLTGKDLTKIFIPYGVILFAFIGAPAIPEMQEQLGKDKSKFKMAIIIGSLLPIVIYIVFTAIIMGMVGIEQFELLEPNQRIATVALSMYSQPILGVFANLLAVLAMFTSFLTIGIALKEIFEYDYGLSRNLSVALTLFVPLIISLLGLTSFIAVLGITGAVGGGIDGILITLMFWKAKKTGLRRPEFSIPRLIPLGVILIVMFTLGILYQVLINL